jgi:hypothetical protein
MSRQHAASEPGVAAVSRSASHNEPERVVNSPSA